MSGETETNVSGWTVDTIRAHFSAQLDDLRTLMDERNDVQKVAMETAFTAADKAVTAALAAAEKAVLKAELAADKRFEAVNEFREQLRDQAEKFMPRSEAVGLAERSTERIDELRDRMGKVENNEKGMAQGRANMIALAGFILSLVLIASVASAIWR